MPGVIRRRNCWCYSASPGRTGDAGGTRPGTPQARAELTVVSVTDQGVGAAIETAGGGSVGPPWKVPENS